LDVNEQMVGQRLDAKTRTSIRNLRIREDTAKYLRNLDVDSAYYDPKSRSMRSNPNPDVKPEDRVYSGDNFVRDSGETHEFYKSMGFAWNQYEKDGKVHIQGAPSLTELKMKTNKKEIVEQKEEKKNELLSRYGSQDTFTAPEETQFIKETEDYVEYSHDGTVIKGREVAIPKSKYEEDILFQNHTQIWGSYWFEFQWGYGCCHQFVKNSYCTGKEGIEAKHNLDFEIRQRIFQKSKEEIPSENATKKTPDQKNNKRTYHGMETEVTEQENQDYINKKMRADDPMAAFPKKK